MKNLCLLAIFIAGISAGPEHMGTPPNVTCPPGFFLAGKNCERPVFGTPQIRCPLGALVGEQCITRAPMSTQCPIGSVPDGTECAVVENMPPDANCPPGYTVQGGSCAHQIPLQLVTTCDIGHDDGTGQCVQVEHAQKVIRTYCPAGYHDEGTGCMKMTSYDCSPPLQVGVGQAPAPALGGALGGAGFGGYSVGGKKGGGHGGYGGHGGHKRMLGAKRGGSYGSYAPPVIAAPPPSKSGLAGGAVKIAAAPAVVVAAPATAAVAVGSGVGLGGLGGVGLGGAGLGAGGVGLGGAGLGAGLGGGLGGGYGGAGMAVPSPAIPAPPAPAVQVLHQTCQRRDFAAPVIESYCPEGFVEMGMSCQRISYYPPTQKCINGAPATSCFEIKTAPKQNTCAKGTLTGDVCQWKQAIPSERVCPAGSGPTGEGDCQQITQPIVNCPAGTTVEGKTCVGREIAQPMGQVTKPCAGKECWA